MKTARKIFCFWLGYAVVAQLAEHLHGKEKVAGSIPANGSILLKASPSMGGYRSSQTGQTVNLLAHAFQGANPCPPIGFADVAQLVEQRFCKP